MDTTTTELTTYDPATTEAASSAAGMFGGLFTLLYVVVLVAVIASLWKLFTKAGKPGWAALVPVYNAYILLKVVGRPGWWLLLFFIPVVNIVISIILALDLGKSFGKDGVFSIVLLLLLAPIGHLILGFGSATYVGPVADPNAGSTPAPPMAPPTNPSSTPPMPPNPPTTPTATPPASSL